MAGKFVLKKGSSGKYHFNLVASNGQVIATSEAYERKQSALNGIECRSRTTPPARRSTIRRTSRHCRTRAPGSLSPGCARVNVCRAHGSSLYQE